MPIDIDKLRRFRIPDLTRVVTPEDVALHALSIGMGHDPSDRAALAFVDTSRGPLVNPALALVLAAPATWPSDPGSGIDPAATLHADQSLELLRLPASAGRVSSTSRITDVVDKGAGRAALIVVETVLRDAQGTFAHLRMTIHVRDGGGFGGPRYGTAATAPTAPDGEPDWVVDLPTRPEQALLYRLNGDTSPIHSDPAAAAAAGFPRPVLHGLCTFGFATHALLRAAAGFRPERLRSLAARFTEPVFPGETLRTEIWRTGRFRTRVVERGCVVLDQGSFTLREAS